jgi:class 3 adenylate cyclase
MNDATIVFVDLAGSTALYQSLGNAKGAELVSGLTDWIGRLCQASGGQVIRYLGDGVLMAFGSGGAAVDCAVQIQCRQNERNLNLPEDRQAELKIGMARGAVVAGQNAWLGEVVNLATSLSRHCVPAQILAAAPVLDQITVQGFARFRSLGSMHMPGRSQSVEVFQIEWRPEGNAAAQTVRGALEHMDFEDSRPMGGICLTGADRQLTFLRDELPIVLGRHEHAHFTLQDASVSRLHVKIYELDGMLVLEDTSRHGTSVRFTSGTTVLTLRSQECVLHDACEIAFGSAFNAGTVPQVALQFFN